MANHEGSLAASRPRIRGTAGCMFEENQCHQQRQGQADRSMLDMDGTPLQATENQARFRGRNSGRQSEIATESGGGICH